MVGYYDFVLGVVPVALLGVPGALHVGGFPSIVAVPVGAVVAAMVIGHAMFVRGPGEGRIGEGGSTTGGGDGVPGQASGSPGGVTHSAD